MNAIVATYNQFTFTIMRVIFTAAAIPSLVNRAPYTTNIEPSSENYGQSHLTLKEMSHIAFQACVIGREAAEHIHGTS